MNIGRASEKTGLPVRTIHYYEEIELIVPARRDNGYRDYSDTDVHKLSFLHRLAASASPLRTAAPS